MLRLAPGGLENFRWHDLRHTWASWLVQNAPAQMAKHAAVVGELLRVINPAQALKIEVETDVKKGATITRNSLI